MVTDLKTGDEAVFREVFYQYSNKLCRYLLLKTQSTYLANEITQLTFIKLWKYRQSLNEEVPLSTQIFQMAKTILIDEFRKEERRRSNLKKLLVAKSVFSAIADNNNNYLQAKDTQRILDQAILKLPPVRKKVFQMSRQEQLSYKEISTSLSISVKTVDKHIQLALQSLKMVIQDKHY